MTTVREYTEDCPRCHKRHPLPWFHAGDCTRCYKEPGVIGRPAIRVNGRKSDFCQKCYDEMLERMKAPLAPMDEEEERKLLARLFP